MAKRKTATEVEKEARKETMNMDATADIYALKIKLKKADDERIKENTRAQSAELKLKRLEERNKSLREALRKANVIVDKVQELITWFEQVILNPDGSFPKFKWYNIGKLLLIVAKLGEFVPEIIEIFKKKKSV